MQQIELENISLKLTAAYEGLEQACGMYSTVARIEESITDDTDLHDLQYNVESAILGSGLPPMDYSSALEGKSSVRKVVDLVIASIKRLFNYIANLLKSLWEMIEEQRGTLMFRIDRARRRLRTKLGRVPNMNNGPALLTVSPTSMYLRTHGKVIRSGADLLQLITVGRTQLKVLDSFYMPECIKLGGAYKRIVSGNLSNPEQVLLTLNDTLRNFPFASLASKLSSKDHFDGQRSSKTSVKLAPPLMGDRGLHIALPPERVDDPIADASRLRVTGMYFAEVPFKVDSEPHKMPVPTIEVMINILDELEGLIRSQPDTNIKKQISEIKALEKAIDVLGKGIEKSGMERKYFEVILRAAGRYPELSAKPVEQFVRYTVVSANTILSFCNAGERMY